MLFPKAEKIVMLKELEKWQETEATRTIMEILSSKHGSVILFINSEQLWFFNTRPAQDQASKHSSFHAWEMDIPDISSNSASIDSSCGRENQ